MVDTKQIQDERHLRILIKKALAKEISPYTKPSIDFIAHIMDEAYEGNVVYNVDDMRNAILGFAASSTNQADTCLKIVAKMHFKSKDDQPYPLGPHDRDVGGADLCAVKPDHQRTHGLLW